MDAPRRPIDWRAVYTRLEETQRVLGATASPSPDVVQQILRRRALALAAPLHDGQRATVERLDLLVFALASERYGMETAHVLEVFVLRGLTPVPCTPAFILGVVNFRGRILPVVNVRKLLNLAGQELPERGLVVAVEAGGMTFGICADAVSGPRQVPAHEVAPSPAAYDGDRAPFIRGVTADMVTVLDLEAVARDPRLVINEEVG